MSPTVQNERLDDWEAFMIPTRVVLITLALVFVAAEP